MFAEKKFVGVYYGKGTTHTEYHGASLQTILGHVINATMNGVKYWCEPNNMAKIALKGFAQRRQSSDLIPI